MYEVAIIKSFSAAHLLAEIGGKCEELHGHNFKVEVTVGAMELNEEGILIDFRLVKKWLGEILGRMDHQHLNTFPFLPESIRHRKISPAMFTARCTSRQKTAM